MKLELLQENLNKALTLTNRIIASKPQLPILANVLLVAKNGKLLLTASNLETSLVVEVGAKIDKAGEFTVPGRTLAETISSLSAEKVSLEVDEGSLLVKAGGFHGRINGVAATEYPHLSLESPSAKDNSWNFDKEEFLSSLEKILFASSLDEGRAALTGVLFKPTSAGLVLVATDGFRLSLVDLKKADVGKKTTTTPIIIPARSLTEIMYVLEGNKGSDNNKILTIAFSTENQLYFDLGPIKIISRLISGNFPDYEKIIPSDSDLQITTSVEELSKAVRLASIFARESANIVKLKIVNSKLLISANAAQVGENESEIDVVSQGKSKSDNLAIAYNFRYLLDFLGVVEGEVSLELSGPVAPGVFKAEAAPGFLHIIMPVRVQS